MKTEDKPVKSYYDQKQEEKKASSPQQITPSGGKPTPGTIEYEVKGIGWNMKGVLKELQELNSTMHAVASLLDDIKRKLPG